MRFFQKLAWQLRRMMYGRYGTDTLNSVLLGAALVCSLVGGFFRHPTVGLVSYVVSMTLLVLATLRMFSKNIAKRRAENAAFLRVVKPRPDAKTHKYFRCPKCRQEVRVPRGKGKIRITCPKCGEKFAKKS